VHARGGVIEGVFERRDFLERVAGVFRAIDRPYLERVAADREPEEIEKDIATRIRERFPDSPS
jgi:thymidylate kinase